MTAQTDTQPSTVSPARRTDVSRRRLMAMAGIGGVGALASTVGASLAPRLAHAEMDMATPGLV